MILFVRVLLVDMTKVKDLQPAFLFKCAAACGALGQLSVHLNNFRFCFLRCVYRADLNKQCYTHKRNANEKICKTLKGRYILSQNKNVYLK